jgi:hypothetical protein
VRCVQQQGQGQHGHAVAAEVDGVQRLRQLNARTRQTLGCSGTVMRCNAGAMRATCWEHSALQDKSRMRRLSVGGEEELELGLEEG